MIQWNDLGFWKSWALQREISEDINRYEEKRILMVEMFNIQATIMFQNGINAIINSMEATNLKLKQVEEHLDDDDLEFYMREHVSQNKNAISGALSTTQPSRSPQMSARKRLDSLFESLCEFNLENDLYDFEGKKFGMGMSSDVYRAQSKRHNRKVAVKCIRVFLLEDESFAKDLEREVRLWFKLNHPNVLPLLGFFLDGPNAVPNLISEWMGNGTMTMYMQDRPFDAVETCEMAAGIATGLVYLHTEQEIVHSDLKGSNILVSDDGRPLLADFGLSISSTSMSLAGTVGHGGKGSLRWMAKELHSTDKYIGHSFETDIWAFGMVICELLTRNKPYPSVPDNRISGVISNGYLPEEPDFNHLANCAVYQELWAICRSCWREVPSERPSGQMILAKIEQSMSLVRVENTKFLHDAV